MGAGGRGRGGRRVDAMICHEKEVPRAEESLAELALHGKFVQLPQAMFFRRMDRASSTLLKSPDENVRHYDPSGRSPMLLQNWKQVVYYVGAVRRAPLSFAERCRLVSCVVHRMFWFRRRLVGDLVGVVRHLSRAR